jgi:integrase
MGVACTQPADRVLPPTHVAPRRKVWSADSLRRFLENTSDHRLYPLWTVLAGTAMRIGEVLDLRWEDVDLSAAKVTVKRSLYRLAWEWKAAEPKTQAVQRVIALPQNAVAAFRKQRVQQAEWRLQARSVWQDTDLVSLPRPPGVLWDGLSSHGLSARRATKRGCPK